MNSNDSNSPSTTPKGGRDRASNSPANPKRISKPTPAQRALMDMKEKNTDHAVETVAKEVEDLLLCTRPNHEEQDTEEVCEATECLLAYNPNTRRMYQRYMDKWKSYVRDKKMTRICGISSSP